MLLPPKPASLTCPTSCLDFSKSTGPPSSDTLLKKCLTLKEALSVAEFSTETQLSSPRPSSLCDLCLGVSWKMRARSLSSREGLGSGGETEAQARPPLSFICTESSRGPSHHSLLSRLRLRRSGLPPGQASPAHTAGQGPCSEEELMMSE